MFKVKLELIGLHTTLHIQQPFTLKLKKQHWHYTLIDKITNPMLSLKHQFLLKEESQKEPSFQLQLLMPTQQNKAKIIGSALININEWPMQKVKRDKVGLSPYVWLDLSIMYEYIMPETPSSSCLDFQLDQIKYEQDIKQKSQLNSYLKRNLLQINQQISQITSKNRQIEQENQRLQQNIRNQQKNQEQVKKAIEQKKAIIENELLQSKLVVTNLINLINQDGYVELVQKLNQFLQKEAQTQAIIQ